MHVEFLGSIMCASSKGVDLTACVELPFLHVTAQIALFP